MATIRLPRDFKEFLELLNSEKIEYLLVGGYAVGVYGYPRATGDMDIWVASNPTNADHLVRVLEKFGFSKGSVSRETFLRADRVLQMGVPPVRIDLLTGVPGLTFESCYPNRETIDVDGVSVSVIALSDLKRNKQASGRPKDQADLENLP